MSADEIYHPVYFFLVAISKVMLAFSMKFKSVFLVDVADIFFNERVVFIVEHLLIRNSKFCKIYD